MLYKFIKVYISSKALIGLFSLIAQRTVLDQVARQIRARTIVNSFNKKEQGETYLDEDLPSRFVEQAGPNERSVHFPYVMSIDFFS